MTLTNVERQQEIIDVAARLGNNPIFQLSTANQELFHSNMLFWLATSAKEHSSPLWDLMIGDGESHIPTGAMREKSQVDLMVTFGVDTRIAIENKIHSIATMEQLVKYTEKLTVNSSQQPKNIFILLSLFSPLFDLPEQWKHVGYSALLDPLATVEKSLAEGGEVEYSHVIKSYRETVEELIRLRDLVDPQQFPTQPLSLSPEVEGHLSDRRLLPLVRKAQAAQLAGMISAALGGRSSGYATRVKAGMTNSTALIEHFLPLRTGANYGRQIGWQVQNGQFRLAVIGRKGDKTKAVVDNESELAKAVEGFIDFSSATLRGEQLPDKPGKRKTWCSYGSQFAYQYKALPDDITPVELVDLCARMSVRTGQEVERVDKLNS